MSNENGKTQEQLMSLYDYLGRAAGQELGREVNRAAMLSNQPVATRRVSNSKYKGEVFLYTKQFLDSYFSKSQGGYVIVNTENDELPF
jgi:hypothetical protein